MTVNIRSGDLNRRITIQQRVLGTDSYGQVSTSWVDVLSCWSLIEPLSGRELELAQAINSEITHKVTILYRTTVTPAMRVSYQGRLFNILSVSDPETAHIILELRCSEGLNLS